MTTEKTKLLELVRQLRDLDHGFLSRQGALHFSQAFGFDAKTWVHQANPQDLRGLTLADGASEADGIGTHDLAAQICQHLDAPFMRLNGRGFQLRHCCDVLDAWIKEH